MRAIAALLAAVSALAAQDAPPASKTPVLNAAVSGMVRDKNSGKPLAGYVVSTYVSATWIGNAIQMSSTTKEVQSTTDETGHYRLGDLPAGPYRISTRDSHGGILSRVDKRVMLGGHDLNDINFDVVVAGVIKGRIVDENKEAVPGITVILISREYYLGSAGYFFRESSRPTNDRGEYTVEGVPAGEPFFLLAELRRRQLPAHSDTPLNQKLRRRVPMRTWYPNSPGNEGAAPVMLRPAETREHVDIEMRKSPAFCAEGTLLTATGGPGAINFGIEGQQPSSGVHEGGAMFMFAGSGTTGADGAFRVCDLSPGPYRIQANMNNGGFVFGAVQINISDQDIKGVKIAALPGQPVAGEVVLEGPVPPMALATKVSVGLTPLLRSHYQGEKGAYANAEIPGTFTLPEVVADDYQVRTTLNGHGLYVKDVQWAGTSIYHQPLRLGAAAGTGLRVVIGQDGGTIATKVSTKDGNPAPGIRTVAFPAEIVSEGMLAAVMMLGQTDQAGAWSSQPLAPGKYYVAAIDGTIDYTVETIARLWRSRSRFAEADLAPNGTLQVALEPMQLAP